MNKNEKEQIMSRRVQWIITIILLHVFFCSRAGSIPDFRNGRYSLSSELESGQFAAPLLTKPKLYRGENSYASFSYFYQHLYNNGAPAGWNVSSAGAFFYFDYLRLELNLDQGIYTGQGDNFLWSDFSYRAGVQIDQSYTNNDSLYFRVMFATDTCFAENTVNAGYSWQTGGTTRLGIEMYGLCFGKKELCFSVAAAFVKTFKRHQLTVKPYYSLPQKWKVNMFVSDKIFVGRKNSSLLIQAATGYFPDLYTFVDYPHINSHRYRFSCEGSVCISDRRLYLDPKLGFEYVGEASSHPGWYVQMGIHFNI